MPVVVQTDQALACGSLCTQGLLVAVKGDRAARVRKMAESNANRFEIGEDGLVKYKPKYAPETVQFNS